MKLISFAWTTGALLAGAKTCTRRDWNPDYARSFHMDELVQAFDKLPRAGGRRVALIRLTAAPEWSDDYPDADYANEGLEWMEQQGLLIRHQKPREFWDAWRHEAKPLWVVRFAVQEAQRD